MGSILQHRKANFENKKKMLKPFRISLLMKTVIITYSVLVLLSSYVGCIQLV